MSASKESELKAKDYQRHIELLKSELEQTEIRLIEAKQREEDEKK